MFNRDILQRIRVLVLEDENDTRDLLGVVLQSHGATVIAAQNVPEALEAVKDKKPRWW